MKKHMLILFFLAILVLLPAVEAVLYADDYFTLYENGEEIPDQSVLIFSNQSEETYFLQIYNGSVFVKSQSMVSNLTFYRVNRSSVLEYETWVKSKNNASYSEYVQVYIPGLVNESLYNTTISIPPIDDTEVYNQPLIGTGGIIGTYRYFNIDIRTSSIELIDTVTTETPGFLLIYIIIAILIVVFIVKLKN